MDDAGVDHDAPSPLRRLLVLTLLAVAGVVLARWWDQRIGTPVVVLALVEQLALLIVLTADEHQHQQVLPALMGMTISSGALAMTWDPRAEVSPEQLLGGLVLLLLLGTWRILAVLHRSWWS